MTLHLRPVLATGGCAGWLDHAPVGDGSVLHQTPFRVTVCAMSTLASSRESSPYLASVSPTSMSCVGMSLAYPHSRAVDARWRHHVLRDVSMRLFAGRCSALIGAGPAPVALLRCLAGLTTPDAGSIRWFDAHGRRAAAPIRAFIPAEWRGYDFLTVRDVLEQAVPYGVVQRDADDIIAHAAESCGLTGVTHARIGELPAPASRITAISAALVTGARWLLIDRRGVDVSPGVAAASDIVEEGRVLRRLVREGVTLVVAGSADACAAAAPTRRYLLPSSRIEPLPRLVTSRHPAGHRPVATAMVPP